jgi:hypothetical protein
MSSPLKVVASDDDVTPERQEVLVEAAENETTELSENRQPSATTKVATAIEDPRSGRKKVGAGRPLLFSEEEIRTAAALKQEGRSLA